MFNSPNQLAFVIAKLVTFAWTDYLPDNLPIDIQQTVGYQCACFVAQYTKDGHNGVVTELAMDVMQVDKNMPYTDRLQLALKFVEEFGGQHD